MTIGVSENSSSINELGGDASYSVSLIHDSLSIVLMKTTKVSKKRLPCYEGTVCWSHHLGLTNRETTEGYGQIVGQKQQSQKLKKKLDMVPGKNCCMIGSQNLQVNFLLHKLLL